MTQYKSTTARPQPTVGRREVRGYMDAETAVRIPLQQAALIAGALGGSAIVIGLVFSVDPAVALATGVFIFLMCFAALFFEFRPDARRQVIEEIEERAGMDMDGDGSVGAPAAEHQIVYTNKAAPGSNERAYRDQVQMVHTMFQLGTGYKSIVGRSWQTTGEKITRRDWEKMRDVLLRSKCAHEDNTGKLALDLGYVDTLKTLGIPEVYWW